jgi:3-oxoacyl-[acyl-carrier protein] reductase
MNLDLGGKVAIVGGGNQGMGRAIAEALAREGASVAIYARSEESLQRAAEEIASRTGRSVVPIPADVTRAKDCERIVEQTLTAFGQLDILVSNMGGPPFGTAQLRTDDEWHQAWELVTLSVIRLCRLAVPHMRKQGGGSIVNITAGGVLQVVPEVALSVISRAATTCFAKYLATDLAHENIRINNLIPGWIPTQRVTSLNEAEAKERGVSVEQVYDEQTAAIPMGRFGTTDEIADGVAFLVSDRASYITGVNLRIDGGWCLGTMQ